MRPPWTHVVLYYYDGNLAVKYAGVNYTDVADLTCGNDFVFDKYTDTNPPIQIQFASICPTTGKWCVLYDGDSQFSISFDAATACGDSLNIVFGSTSRPDTAGTVDLTCIDGVLLKECTSTLDNPTYSTSSDVPMIVPF